MPATAAPEHLLPGAIGTRRARPVLEVLLVLGVSLGESAVYSILRIIERLTRTVPLSQQTSQTTGSVAPDRPWLDLAYQLAGIVLPLVPVALCLYLLWAHAGPRVFGGRPVSVGFDLRRPGFDLGRGVLLAAVIGIPGLGFYLLARQLGINTTVQAGNLADNWWTVPVYVLTAAMNGVLEEVIMIGFVLIRLRQAGWSWWLVLLSSALVRGSYHLYQGFGGFAGNLLMGVVFGLIFLRWKRTGPLVVAHTLLDVVAFVGYALVANRVDWL